MKRIYFIAILATVIAGGIIFYACQKDNNELLTNKAKVTKSNGALVNPMEHVGILHNGCIDYMYSQHNATDLTADELWTVYGVGYFSDRLGADYVAVPLSTINAISEKVRCLVNDRRIVTIIDELAENEKLDSEFSSPYIIENNYTILYNFFRYMDNVVVHSEEDYLRVQQAVVDCEQKILANYYSLLEHGIFENNHRLLAEYEETMACMAIANKSGKIWYRINGEWMALEDWELTLQCQKTDLSAWSDYYNYGNSSSAASQASTKASSDAGKIYLAW